MGTPDAHDITPTDGAAADGHLGRVELEVISFQRVAVPPEITVRTVVAPEAFFDAGDPNAFVASFTSQADGAWVHSTSWRLRVGALVLTFAVVADAGERRGDGAPPPPVAGGAGPSVSEVAAHAVRLMALIVDDHPQLAANLTGGELEVLRVVNPSGAGHRAR